MSGGYWSYRNDYLADEVFGYLYPDYGERGFSQSKQASRLNPMEDQEISEMLWDMFCLMHSFDWYRSGDCSEKTYRADVERFKRKWLGKPNKVRVQRVADRELERVKEEIYRTFGLGVDEEIHDG